VLRGVGWRIYPRHRLDLTTGHLIRALMACARADEPERLERAIEAGAGNDAIVCASVRSGFELLLDALALPPDSEILLTAITHPDMARILERHDLVPVPLDIEPENLAPPHGAVEAAITERTRAILVAHLFGGRIELGRIAALAHERGLLLLEDCAQSFRGPGDRGDESADVSMFSFGSIKTSPALGGALFYVRNQGVLERMRVLQAGWPRQRRSEYATRVVRFFGLCGLQNAAVYGLFVRLGAAIGIDTDGLVNGAVHALRPPSGDQTDEFARWLRRRPSAPLLRLLRHRLGSFDAARLVRRSALGEELAKALSQCLSHPGSGAHDRTHWVFPVTSGDPDGLIAALRAAGFDATRATTSIAAVGSPPPRRAAELMERVVFVPAYPELPPPAVQRLRELLAEAG
jgi:perosamine synthetase